MIPHGIPIKILPCKHTHNDIPIKSLCDLGWETIVFAKNYSTLFLISLNGQNVILRGAKHKVKWVSMSQLISDLNKYSLLVKVSTQSSQEWEVPAPHPQGLLADWYGGKLANIVRQTRQIAQHWWSGAVGGSLLGGSYSPKGWGTQMTYTAFLLDPSTEELDASLSPSSAFCGEMLPESKQHGGTKLEACSDFLSWSGLYHEVRMKQTLTRKNK